MASLARISKIQQRWADRATFLTIYIQGNYKYIDMYCKSINIASRYSIFVFFQKPMQRRRRSLKIHYSRLKHTRVLVKDWRQRVRMTNEVFTFHCCTASPQASCLGRSSCPGRSWWTTCGTRPPPRTARCRRDSTSSWTARLSTRQMMCSDTPEIIDDNNISREVSDPTITIRRKSIRGWKNIFRNSVDNII